MTRQIDQAEAVILSGGAAYGAYEVGVMKALFRGESPSTGYDYLNPGIFSGTSVGAFNAAFIVSRPDDDVCATISQLESTWLNRVSDNSQRCGNGVFRFRGNPIEYLDPQCVALNPLRSLNELFDDGTFLARDWFGRAVNFVMTSGGLAERALELIDFSAFISSAPIGQLAREEISLEGIRRSGRKLRVIATNWYLGALAIFENQDMTDENGHEIIRGSAAIPGVFRPHTIAGQPYVDGGVLMNTPLKCAIQAGGTRLHVIYVDPDVKNIPLRSLQSTIDTLDRMLVITWANKVSEDIDAAARINEGLEVIERTASGEALTDADMRAFIKVASQIYQKIRASAPYKKLTIHRYHPHDDLGRGTRALLNFNRDRIAALIDRGFNDALNHDCEKSHCII